jgi:hypothetical protein
VKKVRPSKNSISGGGRLSNQPSTRYFQPVGHIWKGQTLDRRNSLAEGARSLFIYVIFGKDKTYLLKPVCLKVYNHIIVQTRINWERMMRKQARPKIDKISTEKLSLYRTDKGKKIRG